MLGPLGLVDLDNPPPHLADGPILFAESMLKVPSGLHALEPLRLSDEQVELLIAWFTVWPDGRAYVNPRGHVEAGKGWSKSPVGMICAAWDLVGESVPDGLDAHGRPVGRPHPNPMVQIAGPTEDNTDNLYGQLYDALSDSPALDVFRIDLGVTKTTLIDRPGSIEPVTASTESREGNPVSAIYREETHLWRVQNGGRRLAGTLNRNARKMAARILDLTNTPIPKVGSVAEQTIAALESGRQRGLLVQVRAEPPLEVVDLADDAKCRRALEQCYGSHVKRRCPGSRRRPSTDDECPVCGVPQSLDGRVVAVHETGWVDLDELLEDRPPGDTTAEEWLRFYTCKSVGDAESVLDVKRWLEELGDPSARLTLGDTIALGFDGSDVGDATALYACRWPDWTLFQLAVWERPRDPATGQLVRGWRVPRDEVRAEMALTMRRYRVVKAYCDPAYWQTDIDEWAGEWDCVERFPHHSASRIGPACERWSTMVNEGTLRHDGKLTIVEHAANARRERIGPATAKWWRPVRRHEGGGYPIDAFSAAVSAVDALGDAVADGKIPDEDVGEDFADVVDVD